MCVKSLSELLGTGMNLCSIKVFAVHLWRCSACKCMFHYHPRVLSLAADGTCVKTQSHLKKLTVWTPLPGSYTLENKTNVIMKRIQHLLPSKCILQLSSAGWISFPSDSQSTSMSGGPVMTHSNMADSPALTATSFTSLVILSLPCAAAAAKRTASIT